MSRKYTVLTLMIVMITLVTLIQGKSVAQLATCEYSFSYYNGCNTCLCDMFASAWLCTSRWCGDSVILKPPPCLCE
ncbi:uncharacterized protein [Mycetomoellerius zeteki]|uniref:uncharacterized protein n=1 Tax=Mycetomoellerius zeteki TaxID=64791 RepID=UPI00084E44C5|nr:PREDICTED: uncharacterized protein LOC108721490 [Trachymyrmex zeteki]